MARGDQRRGRAAVEMLRHERLAADRGDEDRLGLGSRPEPRGHIEPRILAARASRSARRGGHERLARIEAAPDDGDPAYRRHSTAPTILR